MEISEILHQDRMLLDGKLKRQLKRRDSTLQIWLIVIPERLFGPLVLQNLTI
jgi:hypothetical protein